MQYVRGSIGRNRAARNADNKFQAICRKPRPYSPALSSAKIGEKPLRILTMKHFIVDQFLEDQLLMNRTECDASSFWRMAYIPDDSSVLHTSLAD